MGMNVHSVVNVKLSKREMIQMSKLKVGEVYLSIMDSYYYYNGRNDA